MKAYRVITSNDYCDSYELYIHADSPGKAKYKAQQNDPGFDFADENWNALRAYRQPKLDDKSFTIENFHAAGIHFYFEGEEYDDIVNECRCEECK